MRASTQTHVNNFSVDGCQAAKEPGQGAALLHTVCWSQCLVWTTLDNRVMEAAFGCIFRVAEHILMIAYYYSTIAIITIVATCCHYYSYRNHDYDYDSDDYRCLLQSKVSGTCNWLDNTKGDEHKLWQSENYQVHVWFETVQVGTSALQSRPH